VERHGNQFLSIGILKMFLRNIDSILDILTNFTIIPNGDYGEVESGFQRAYLPFDRGQGDRVTLKSLKYGTKS
jgi:predicted secreted acid phosphatase